MLTAASALVLHSAQCFTWGVGGMGCTRDGVVLLQLQAGAKEGDRPAWSAASSCLGAGHAAKKRSGHRDSEGMRAPAGRVQRISSPSP